jgi:3-phosphoshikimate 1-carboxyvinyltransferase
MTRFSPSGALRGALRAPPDKSVSHRTALIGAMGEGATRIEGYLDAADTRATLAAVRALGASVEELGASTAPGGLDVVVEGVGLLGPGARYAGEGEPAAIDVLNAGTLLRILPGWLAGQGKGCWVLDGDESIRRRPVDRVAEPLGAMGASVDCREGRLPPLRVRGANLQGRPYRMPVASAQVKSCVLIAGLLADGETQIVEPAPTRDHTERLLAAAGAEIESARVATVPVGGRGLARRITVRRTERLEPGSISVPGDFSSASFAAVAASILGGSSVRLESVGLNPTRVGLLGIMNRMGAAVEVEEDAVGGIEPQGTIVVRQGPLVATRVRAEEVPLAIDELPLEAITAWPCWVRSPGSPRERESRSWAWTPPRSATRASRRTSPPCSPRTRGVRETPSVDWDALRRARVRAARAASRPPWREPRVARWARTPPRARRRP